VWIGASGQWPVSALTLVLTLKEVKMKKLLLQNLLGVLSMMLTPELMKSFADMALDFVEDRVKGSKSTVDDKLILPICDSIRVAFNIPDND